MSDFSQPFIVIKLLSDQRFFFVLQLWIKLHSFLIHKFWFGVLAPHTVSIFKNKETAIYSCSSGTFPITFMIFCLFLQGYSKVYLALISMFLKCFSISVEDVQSSLYFNHEECLIQKIKRNWSESDLYSVSL